MNLPEINIEEFDNEFDCVTYGDNQGLSNGIWSSSWNFHTGVNTNDFKYNGD